MSPIIVKLAIFAAIILGIGYVLIAQPSPEDFSSVLDYFKNNFSKICFVACVIGQCYSFLTKNPIRFAIFSGSLVVTWVLGW